MNYDLLVRGGHVVRGSGIERTDIGVAGGRIVELAPEIASGPNPPEEIDARGLLVFPGVIDSHVHFNDPGRAHWEGVATGSAALAAGGGVCFIDMPLNSSPPTLDGPAFDAKRAVCDARSRTDFALYGGLTPESLPHMEELADRGVAGFKAFMCPSGIDDFTHADDVTLYRGMEIAAGVGLPVLLHAESASMTATLTATLRGEGRRDVRAFLESRPVIAELEAIGRALLYAEETGCSVHIVHVSNRRGVELVRRAASQHGVDASCETCPHYLFFTDRDMESIGPRAKCAPPLRDDATRRALLQELIAGRIDTVGSDHSPSSADLKDRDDFFDVWGGIAGVQTTLRTLMTLDVPLPRIAQTLAEMPAYRFRLPGKGSIEVGNDADFVIVEDTAPAPLTDGELRDKHKLSPYVGQALRGTIRRVLLRGRPVTDETRGRLVVPQRG